MLLDCLARENKVFSTFSLLQNVALTVRCCICVQAGICSWMPLPTSCAIPTVTRTISAARCCTCLPRQTRRRSRSRSPACCWSVSLSTDLIRGAFSSRSLNSSRTHSSSSGITSLSTALQKLKSTLCTETLLTRAFFLRKGGSLIVILIVCRDCYLVHPPSM